jgi:hypothetical protein
MGSWSFAARAGDGVPEFLGEMEEALDMKNK